MTEAAELGQIAAAARVGLKNSATRGRAAKLLAGAGVGTDRGLLDTHTVAGRNLQAHCDCLRRFHQDVGVVATGKGNGAHQSLTWEEANAARVEAARQLGAGASAMLWSVSFSPTSPAPVIAATTTASPVRLIAVPLARRRRPGPCFLDFANRTLQNASQPTSSRRRRHRPRSEAAGGSTSRITSALATWIALMLPRTC